MLAEQTIFVLSLGQMTTTVYTQGAIVAAGGPIAARTGTALVPKATAPLGEWGEARLAQVLEGSGFKPSKPFVTSLGRRFVDRLVNGVAHEAKAGLNVSLTSSIRTQVLKDAELIETGTLEGAQWHFFQGAEPELLEFLEQNGIGYTLH